MDEGRLARIEARQEIAQLAMRYALAVDSRDLRSLVRLFAADVVVPGVGSGRDALLESFDATLRRFHRSIHAVAGHVIDLIDHETATGVVTCRAEHESGDRWIVAMLCYHDDYVQREGSWFFLRRRVRNWYAVDALERPSGPEFVQWPGNESMRARAPGCFPTWHEYWGAVPPAQIASITEFPETPA